MPLYEYQCQRCDHRFEVILQKFSDPPVEHCPKCGGPVHKLMSSPAIQFKGSGWYITDYPKKESGTAEKSGEGPSADTQDGASKSTETKSEARPDVKADGPGAKPDKPDTKPNTKSDPKPEPKVTKSKE